MHGADHPTHDAPIGRVDLPDAPTEPPLPPPQPDETASADDRVVAFHPLPAPHDRPGAAPATQSAVGRLVPFWRIALGGAWIAAFFAYAAVWQASVQLGIATWWIGPRSQPTPTAIRILPFFLCLTVAVLALYNLRRLVEISAVGAALAAVFALPDLERSVGLAVVELVIAGILAVVTAASATGRYVAVPTAGDADGGGGSPGVDVTGG